MIVFVIQFFAVSQTSEVPFYVVFFSACTLSFICIDEMSPCFTFLFADEYIVGMNVY